MKAITIWGPWAHLIALGAKPFEFRGWAAPRALVGMRIAIHAGARPVRPSEVRGILFKLRGGSPWEAGLVPEIATPFLWKVLTAPKSLPLSHVLCTVVLGAPVRATSAVMAHFGMPAGNDSDRDEHFNFAWPMLEVEPLTPPVPARGAQGFWNWTP